MLRPLVHLHHRANMSSFLHKFGTSRAMALTCSKLSTYFQSSGVRVIIKLVPKRGYHSNIPPGLYSLLSEVPRSKRLYDTFQKLPRSYSYKRNFTISPEKFSTVPIFNARKDDQGKDITIEITPRASNRLKEIMSEDSNPNLALRVQVENGGCHGFQYHMSLVSLPPIKEFAILTNKDTKSFQNSPDPSNIESLQKPESSIPTSTDTGGSYMSALSEDDTVFATENGTGAKVVMNVSSLEILKGSKVDYTMELIGCQFKIIDNPLATSSCGCGTSFDIN